MTRKSHMSDEDEWSGRCPNCDEDELDGEKCLYCGWPNIGTDNE